MKFIVAFLAIANVILLSLIVRNRFDGIFHSPEIEGDQFLELIQGKDSGANSKYVLYIFYHGDGNCDCLEDWPNWVDLYERNRDILSVKGVFNGADIEKFKGFTTGFNIPFPIYFDSGDRFRKSLHVKKNIVTKVLVDSMGDLVLSDSNQVRPMDQYNFQKRVETFLSDER